MKIVVVGAGIIGLTSAYALVREGHAVTVLDACHEPGQGTSYANGGQLSYSYVTPLADASIWKNLPHYLLHPDSPLTLRPRLDLAQWRWCVKFLLVCNARASARATEALLRLAFHSRDCLAALQQEVALDFDFRQAGKLVMVSSAAGLEAARRQVDMQRAFGSEQQVLDMAQCVALEPALGASGTRWRGGVYTPSEQVGDCAAFCTQLAAALAQAGVQFAFDTTVSGAALERGRAAALHTSAGDLAADCFVLANGCGGAQLARRLGLDLPIYPLKGYSVTLATGNGAAAPSISITDLARKIVYARLGDRLRVAGRLEIVGGDLSPGGNRCQALADEARALFPGLPGGEPDIAPWAGNRPSTPTGVPIIGASPLANVYVNAGHGALGWTLACGSAALLADLIERRAGAVSSDPFAYHA
jgi:D-amino-acid dehydrogenase